MQPRILIAPKKVDGAFICAATDFFLTTSIPSFECNINDWNSLHRFWQYLYQRHPSKHPFIGVLNPATNCFYYQEFIFWGKPNADKYAIQRDAALEMLKNESKYNNACIAFGFSSGLDDSSERDIWVQPSSDDLPSDDLPPIFQYIQDVVCLQAGAIVPTFGGAAVNNQTVASTAISSQSSSNEIRQKEQKEQKKQHNLSREEHDFARIPHVDPSYSCCTLLNMLLLKPEVAKVSAVLLTFGLLAIATGGTSLILAGGSSLLVKGGILSSFAGSSGLLCHFFAKMPQAPLGSSSVSAPNALSLRNK